MAWIFVLVKIMITIMTALLLHWKLKKQNILYGVIFRFIICIFIGLLANEIVGLIPPLKDRVELTALREGTGGGYEVFLKSYAVDGKEYEIENAVEGKWFWLGNVYGWRDNKSNGYQPDGVTDTVVVEVPVGLNRKISFVTGNYKGLVQISISGNEKIVDSRTTDTVAIPRSDIGLIIANILWRIALFLLIELIFVFIVYFGYCIWQEEVYKEKHAFLYILICLAIIYLIILIPLSRRQSFWVDEMFQIGFSGGDNSLLETFLIHETTPPLYRLLANIWYHIVPYGEGWLLLLSELFVAASVIVMGFAGFVYCNKRAGINVAVIMMTSVFVAETCSFEFRSYSLLLLLSSLILLLFITRWKNDGHKIKDYLLQWLIMFLLCYTHYFGLFLCMSLFLVDFLLMLLRKSALWGRFWGMYILLGMSYIPWVCHVIRMGHLGKSDIGEEVTIASFYTILNLLVDTNKFLFLLLIIAAISLIIEAIVLWERYKDVKQLFNAIPIMTGIILFSGLACYGIYVNTDLTLWVVRYFTVLYPWLALVIGTIIERIVHGITETSAINIEKRKIVFLVIPLTLFFFLGVPAMSTLYQFMQKPILSQDYIGAADYLYDYNQGEVYCDNVAVAYLRSATGYEGKGWYEYYITKQGKRDGLNFISCTADLEYEDFKNFYEQYDTVIVCTMPFSLNQCNVEWIKWIKENYKLVESNDAYQIYIFRNYFKELDCELGVEINFGETGNSRNIYIAQGMGAPEGQWSWMIGDMVEMYCNFGEEKLMHAVIDTEWIMNNQQRVKIVIDDQEVFDDVVHQGNKIEFDFSNKMRGLTKIQFMLPDAIAPAALGQSKDERELSLAIRSMKITLVEDGECRIR